MSKEISNSDGQQIPRRVLDSFAQDEKEQLNEVWSLSRDRTSDIADISPEEAEQALGDIHIRLGFEDRQARVLNFIQDYSRYVAAAIALIVLGTAFLMVPRSVEAPLGDIAELTLPDGSMVELNSGSEVQFNRLYGITNRDISLNGEAFFRVESSDLPFEVAANGAVVKVLGTQFNVRSWADHPENETRVAVLEGRVAFYPASQAQQSVSLTGNEASVWKPGYDNPELPQETVMERETGWRDRKFIFYEESLQEIFKEVERRFDVSIELQNNDVAAETLTGYYGQVSGPESLLNDICTVAGLNYSKTATGYRVY